jgi:hypothetical protein
VVELRVEPPLVLLAAGDEEDIGVLGREQLRDRVLAPELAPVRLDGTEQGRGRVGRRASSRRRTSEADNGDLALSQAPQPTSSCSSSFRQIV